LQPARALASSSCASSVRTLPVHATAFHAHADPVLSCTDALRFSKLRQLAYARKRLHRLPRLTSPPNTRIMPAPRACLCHRLSVHRRTVAPNSHDSGYRATTRVSLPCPGYTARCKHRRAIEGMVAGAPAPGITIEMMTGTVIILVTLIGTTWRAVRSL